MKVKIRKLSEKAVIPFYAHNGDAGMDLTAISKEYDPITNCYKYCTGLAIEIPEGYVGLIFPRSSIYRYDLILANCVGVVDSNYRGEIIFFFNIIDKRLDEYKVGDRIGQLLILPYPQIELVEVDELSKSNRGINGYGSTGR